MLSTRTSLRALTLGASLVLSVAAFAAPGYKKAPSDGMPPEAIAAGKKYAIPAPSTSFKIGAKQHAILNTNRGVITIELNPHASPLNARSFAWLVKKGFYNGTVFHRWADLTGQGGYIIQGGDPFTKSAATKQFAGIGGPGYEVPLEHSSLKHDKLVIAAARSSDPDSAGSQFYITQAPVHFLDGQYTVFGKVVAGQKAALALRQGDKIISARLAN